MEKFWEFIRAVFSHWEPVMSGVFVALFLWLLSWLYEQRQGAGSLPWYIYVFVAGAFLFYACYRAWLEKDTLLTRATEDTARLNVVTELQVRCEVHGIPEARTIGTRALLFIPEVTIANSSHTRTASIGVELEVPMGGGGIACLAPENTPVQEWEQSPRRAGNHCLSFPLNLPAEHAASGYIAFGTTSLKGLGHTPDFKHCEIQFTDLHTGEVIYSEPVRFIVNL